MRFTASRASARMMTAVLTLTTVLPARAQEPAPEEPSGDSGFFFYSGGAARAKRARTQTAASSFASSAWTNLPGASLTFVVPAGSTELFNVSFSGECNKTSAGGHLRIRIVDTVGLITVPLEPFDAADPQAFCSDTTRATYKGNWVRRVGAGTHTLRVQFFNVLPGTGIVDNWTFELVVYD